MQPVLSTFARTRPGLPVPARRRLIRTLGAGIAVALLAGCVGRTALHDGPVVALSEVAPPVTEGTFVMRDGAKLPYRAWLPDGAPRVVILALHGFNDSRNAWEFPAPDFATAGFAVYAPDQRGFGAAPGRGYWPGGQVLVDDAREMIAVLRQRYPGTRLVLMGESMGAAVLMRLATGPAPPADIAGYVLIAPAVWGRASMPIVVRAALWFFSYTLPGWELTGGFLHIRASDNIDALRRLGRDPLHITATRLDTVRGLVDLMDSALAAAPAMHVRSLFLYGGKDEVVPPEATAATWRALPPEPVRAFYPAGYHLLLRDLERAAPIGDIVTWIEDPEARLASGAEPEAAAWLKSQH